MTRDEAIKVVAQHDLKELAPQKRETLLLDWWSIQPGDPEYDGLPELLKAELGRAREPDDPMLRRYDPLLLIALSSSLLGVINSYLEGRLACLGIEAKVEGRAEGLALCRCCNYYSLRKHGAYEICRVCFWEDDGSSDLEAISSANHMTLGEARKNFRRFGAITMDAVGNVLPDGKERYIRDRSADSANT
jgi:hypothetical protein